MNLDGMLREGSLTDLGWMRSPEEETFDIEELKAPNNIKEEAQTQWGYNDMSPIFTEDEPSGIVGEKPRKSGQVVAFVRHMMNQGRTAFEIDREIKKRFVREEISAEVDGLREMFSLDGIVGRVAVDARGYESCKEAMMAAELSPHKGTLRFIMGCSCGEPQMVQVDDGRLDVVSSSGNATDDFLSISECHSANEVPHCRSTMLPLYAAVDDLDPSWVDDLMITVENVSGLPGDDVSRIRKMDKKPIEKVKEAFRKIDARSREEEAARYAGKVDSSEFRIEMAETIGGEVPNVLPRQEDVDMRVNLKGTFFEGSDVIELEDVKVPESDLEMSLDDSEMTW